MNTETFKAISHPVRRDIIDVLVKEQDSSITQITTHFDLTRQAISKHLEVLRTSGLVEFRETGREKLYRVNPRPLKDCYDWVSSYKSFWESALDNLENHLDQN